MDWIILDSQFSCSVCFSRSGNKNIWFDYTFFIRTLKFSISIFLGLSCLRPQNILDFNIVDSWKRWNCTEKTIFQSLVKFLTFGPFEFLYSRTSVVLCSYKKTYILIELNTIKLICKEMLHFHRKWWKKRVMKNYFFYFLFLFFYLKSYACRRIVFFLYFLLF